MEFRIFKKENQSEEPEGDNTVTEADPQLENGLKLPQKLQKNCTKDKMGVLLEEIDPFYKDTLVLISRGSHVINRFSWKESCLSVDSPVRRIAIRIVSHFIFMTLLVKMILTNCLICAFTLESTYVAFEVGALATAFLELMLKIIARGIYNGQFSYIRMPWNWLDLAIIFLGCASFFTPDRLFYWLTILRTFKLIPLIPGIFSAFNLLKDCSRKLLDVLIFSKLPIFIISVISLQMYMGTLTQKCIKVGDIEGEAERKYISENQTNWLPADNLQRYKLCGLSNEPNKTCPEDYTCIQGFGENPDSDYTQFDNIFWALLSVLRLIFQDFYHLLYQQILTVAGPWRILLMPCIFFFGTFILGSFAYAVIGKELLDSMSKEESASEITAEADGSKPNDSVRVSCRQKCLNLVEHRVYESFVTIVIILDILCLFTHHYGAPSAHFHASVAITSLALGVYVVDFIMRLITESPTKYFSSTWHCFDCFILVIAGIYSLMYGLEFIEDENMTRTVTFYSLRAFKLAPLWPSLDFHFRIMFKTICSVYGVICVFGIILFNLSVLGYVLFSATWKEPTLELPKWNFSNFANSFGYSTKILAGEWIEFIWQSLRLGGKPWATFFFAVIAVLIGNLIVMVLTVHVALTSKSTVAAMPVTQRKTALQIVFIPFNLIYKKLSGICCKPQNGTVYARGATAVFPKRDAPLPVSYVGYRKNLETLNNSKPINVCSITLIFIGSILLALNPFVAYIYYFDLFFTIYFLVELLLRIIGSKCGSLKKKEVWFDMIVIGEMVVNLFVYRNFDGYLTCNTGSCGVIWIRNLRPLMLLNRIEMLRVIAEQILDLIWVLFSYIAAGVYIWLVFSIIGVQNFGGRFHKCIDSGGNALGYIQTIEECLQDNQTWANSHNNFDNLIQGFLSLTHVASLDSWIGIVNDAMDATEPDLQPVAGSSWISIFYFIGFYFFGVFFVLSTIFGIIYSTFPKEKGYTMFRTECQIKSYEENSECKEPTEATEPKFKFLLEFYNLVMHSNFEKVIIGVVLVDCLLYALETYRHPVFQEDVLAYAHGFILVVYIVEFCLKILALGHHYFKSILNWLDVVAIISSILGLIFSDLFGNYFVPVRILRTLRLVKFLQNQNQGCLHRQRILDFFLAFRLTLPVFVNFVLFYFIFLFTFSVFGFEIFGAEKVKFDNGESFNDIISSIATTFEISTFSGWSAILDTLLALDVGRCKGPIFVHTFLALTFLVVVNMYLAFIAEIVSQFNRNCGGVADENVGKEKIEDEQVLDAGNSNDMELPKRNESVIVVEEQEDITEVK